MDIIQQVEELILKDNLSSKSRQRDKVYKRSYLYSILIEMGFNLTETGKLFNRDHATVINALKVHDEFYDKDKVYMRYIKHYDQIFRPVSEIPKQFISVDVQKDSIFDDIINCHNTTELRMIKDKILAGGYDKV